MLLYGENNPQFSLHYLKDIVLRAQLLILKRLNLSFTPPTYTLAKADSKKHEQFREDFYKTQNHKDL